MNDWLVEVFGATTFFGLRCNGQDIDTIVCVVGIWCSLDNKSFRVLGLETSLGLITLEIGEVVSSL